MNYWNYVIAAYLVFVVVLLWDFVAPRIQVRQLLRAAKVRASRQAQKRNTPPSPTSELQR
jgi:heme exporter protein D